MPAFSGKVARVRRTAVTATNSTNEAATLSTDGVTLTINATQKRHWDRNSTLPSVFVSGATGTVNTDSKTFNYVQGIITFATAHSTAATYTIDVDWLASSYLGVTNAWELNADVDMLDVTSFSTTATDPKWRTFKPGLSGASATLSRYVAPGTTADPLFFDLMNTDSSDLIVELIAVSSDRAKYEFFGRVQRDSYQNPLDGLGTESVDIQVDGQVYYSTA